MEQLTGTLGSVDVVLSGDVLDRIDAVVPPGTAVDPSDAGWTPPSIADAWRRRRPPAARRG